MQNATGTTCSIIKKGAQVPLHPEITAEDPFFKLISSSWGEALRSAFYSLPDYSFDDPPA